MYVQCIRRERSRRRRRRRQSIGISGGLSYRRFAAYAHSDPDFISRSACHIRNKRNTVSWSKSRARSVLYRRWRRPMVPVSLLGRQQRDQSTAIKGCDGEGVQRKVIPDQLSKRGCSTGFNSIHDGTRGCGGGCASTDEDVMYSGGIPTISKQLLNLSKLLKAVEAERVRSKKRKQSLQQRMDASCTRADRMLVRY